MPTKAIMANPERDAALRYSPAVEVRGEARTLYISGQIGVNGAGATPSDFPAQAQQAWDNVVAVLGAAGMGIKDLVKVTAFLTAHDDYAAYTEVRGKVLGDHKPASTLLIVAGLARAEWKVEIEAIAVA